MYLSALYPDTLLTAKGIPDALRTAERERAASTFRKERRGGPSGRPGPHGRRTLRPVAVLGPLDIR